MRRLAITRLNFTRPESLPLPGDPCPRCDGTIGVYSVKRNPDTGVVTRYLECAECGHKPQGNKWVSKGG